MSHNQHLAVNVFEDDKSSNPDAPTSNDDTNPSQNTGNNQTTSQVTDAREEIVTEYIPWIAAGLIAVVILISLWAIIRRLDKRKG